MPSGITQGVYDGNLSLRDFILRASRSFGPTGYHFDEERNLPELINLSEDYRVESLKKSIQEKKDDLLKYEAMTIEEWDARQVASRNELLAAREASEAKNVELRASYDAVIEKVSGWMAPLSRLQAFKDFMLMALRESRQFDAGPMNWPIEPLIPAKIYRDKIIESTRTRLARDEKELVEVIQGVNDANVYIAALVNALPAE